MPRTPLITLTLLAFCSADAAGWDWSLPGSASSVEAKTPGTRAWWKKHKGKATMVPHKGYQVPGYDGFFDGAGVPITASIDEQQLRIGQEVEKEGGLLPGLDPKKAAAAVKEAAGYGPNQQQAQALLEHGVQEFEAGRYKSAADDFETAADRWPGTDLAAKAHFNRGEAYFFAKDYKKASDAYIELLDKHPSTPKLDAAVERLWEIAQYWETLHFGESYHAPFDYQPFAQTRPTFDTVGHSVRLYEAIRLNDPTGPRADDAIMATAGVHFRRSRFHDADYHYTLLREEYPRSEHQFDAHVLGLQAKLRRYHGADYDGTPLREAQRLEELTRANFSGRLSDEERGRLTEVRAQIARAVEERDLQMIDFYEGTEHLASARYYIDRFADENPKSPATEQAKARLASYEGRPDSPDVPMEWLVNLFPENRRYEQIESVEEIAPAAAPLSPEGGRTMVATDPSQDTATR